MLAIVGSRDARIGFGLAGVKKAYKSAEKIHDEKIVLVEITTAGEQKSSGLTGAIAVRFSFKDDIREIPEFFVKQVIGANVVIK